MAKKKLLLMMMSFLVALGGFWALQAQDPAPQNPRTDPPTTQTDLSGTYTGTFNCDALGLTGDTTLTITGNDFTTADGKTGRIVASTTGGYTAVALQVGGTGPTAATTATTPATPPMIVSMRARKSGTRLILTPAPGATMKCSFTPSRGTARGRRTPRTPAATGTDVAAPATSPTPAESPMPTPAESPTPSPAESPTPTQTPSPIPSPSPTESPTPMPSPTPSESPTPMPSPSPGEPTPSPTPGEPTPSPSPGSSPSPSPTPTPTPSPRR